MKNNPERLTMVKVLLRISAFFMVMLSTSVHAEPIDDDKICKMATEFEETFSKRLPMPVDSMTDVISMRINCVTKTQSWAKVLKVTEDLLAQGWQERKQRQHTQLHCNRDGFTGALGWTVLDQLYDKDFKLIAEFKTTPDMCT